MLMSKSCKPLYPGLFLLGAATAALVFAAPQTCAAALRQGLSLCGEPLLVSLFPFLVVSALIMRSGAGEVLGVLLWPVVRCIGLRSRSAGSVLLIGLVGGFAPAAAAAAEAVRSSELTPQEASALLPAKGKAHCAKKGNNEATAKPDANCLFSFGFWALHSMVFLLFMMVAFSFVLFYHRTAKYVNGCAQKQVLKGLWHLSPNFGYSTQNPGHAAK